MKISLTPFVRQASVVDIVPRLKKKQVSAVTSQLLGESSRLQAKYRDIVASVMGVDGSKMQFAKEEHMRKRWEMDTGVLEWQRLEYKDNAHSAFDARLGVAICTGKMSTKVWSRIGMSSTASTNGRGISVEELQNVTAQYREVTEASSTWMSKQMEEMIGSQFREVEVRQLGQLEVSCFGVRDENFARHFGQLWKTGATIAEVLQDPEACEQFSWYFNEASDIKGDPLELTERCPQDHYWLPSKIWVEVPSGYMEERIVPYLVSSLNGKLQVLGIACDDSVDGSLAHRSVTQVARWIGMRV